ncbi:DUF6777 domain-containing protein [Streptomyces sp. NPDC051569]|uniref:DUF6777 domain-containing protein n=1 Tax=Streptomyces sp. NPDC051569 TaxID=3365661 RepID=UPI0037909194
MRSPNRRRLAALAALSVGILITAGCGGDGAGEDAVRAKELFLQRAADPGPDPFTPSTAKAPPADRTSPPGARAGSPAGQRARALPGSTPGLYGGARSLSSCDGERQVRFLTEDRTKARAFAQGAGISQVSVPGFLRGLTPVFLRADTRVTNYGYRGGNATAFQSVLQAGTAVMVDGRGLPRLRCAGGSPLRPPVAAQGSVTHRGKPWAGYRPERVVVITRTTDSVNSLIISDAADGTWIERNIGTDGDEDANPEILPAYGPDADVTDANVVKPPDAASRTSPAGQEPAAPGERSGPGDPGGSVPGADAAPAADCPPPSAQAPGCPAPAGAGDTAGAAFQPDGGSGIQPDAQEGTAADEPVTGPDPADDGSGPLPDGVLEGPAPAISDQEGAVGDEPAGSDALQG